MADDTTPTPTPQTEPTPDPASPQPVDGSPSPAAPAVPAPDEAALGDAGKRALDAERQARKAAEKTAADALARVKAFETEKLSDLERAQQQAKDAQEAAAKATTEALRLRLAARNGLSEEDAELFLVGTDEATLAAQAARVAALRGAQSPAQPRTPSPDPAQGARDDPQKTDEDRIYESLFGAPTRK